MSSRNVVLPSVAGSLSTGLSFVFCVCARTKPKESNAPRIQVCMWRREVGRPDIRVLKAVHPCVAGGRRDRPICVRCDAEMGRGILSCVFCL